MKNNIEIALVTPYPPSKTTLNEYGYYLARNLAEKPEVGRLHILSENLDINYTSDNEKVTFQPCWKFNSMANPLKILRKVRSVSPDIVIINQQFLLFGDRKVAAALGLMLPFLLKLFGIRCIVLMHNILEEVDLGSAGITGSRLMKWAYGLIGNILTRFILMADLVGVTIEKYVDVLRKKYNKKNVVLLPHGTFEIPEIPDFALSGDDRRIMTFGKFGTYKKVEVLIEAFKKLQREGVKNISLCIAGTDSPNKKGYLGSVAREYSEVEGIEFTGYVPEEDVARIFQESAMVVFPYTSTTGSSGVLHQAGSYGKPAILPDVGDLGRLIREEGYDGEFFAPDSVDELAAAINRLLTDEPYRQQLARTNYEAATALPLSDISDWYLLHIQRLIGKK